MNKFWSIVFVFLARLAFGQSGEMAADHDPSPLHVGDVGTKSVVMLPTSLRSRPTVFGNHPTISFGASAAEKPWTDFPLIRCLTLTAAGISVYSAWKLHQSNQKKYKGLPVDNGFFSLQHRPKSHRKRFGLKESGSRRFDSAIQFSDIELTSAILFRPDKSNRRFHREFGLRTIGAFLGGMIAVTITL